MVYVHFMADSPLSKLKVTKIDMCSFMAQYAIFWSNIDYCIAPSMPWGQLFRIFSNQHTGSWQCIWLFLIMLAGYLYKLQRSINAQLCQIMPFAKDLWRCGYHAKFFQILMGLNFFLTLSSLDCDLSQLKIVAEFISH